MMGTLKFCWYDGR